MKILKALFVLIGFLAVIQSAEAQFRLNLRLGPEFQFMRMNYKDSTSTRDKVRKMNFSGVGFEALLGGRIKDVVFLGWGIGVGFGSNDSSSLVNVKSSLQVEIQPQKFDIGGVTLVPYVGIAPLYFNFNIISSKFNDNSAELYPYLSFKPSLGCNVFIKDWFGLGLDLSYMRGFYKIREWTYNDFMLGINIIIQKGIKKESVKPEQK